MGYIDFLDTKDLLAEVREDNPDVSDTDSAAFESWAKDNGFELQQLPISKGYYATKELPLFTRVLRFYSNLLVFDHPNKVQDPDNKDLKRGYKIENDPMVGWALTGSGTQYKYQIYFNGQFPFIHQNILHFNLGLSYPSFNAIPVTEVIGGPQGKAESKEVNFASRLC